MTNINHKLYAKEMMQGAFIFRATSEVLPTWFLFDKNERVQIVGTPWNGYEEKKKAAEVIAEIIIEFEIKTVLFISDVWTRHLPKDAPEEEKRIPVSEQLDAVEAIVAQCWNFDKTGFTLMQKYRQHDNGTIHKMDYIEMNEAKESYSETDTFREVLKALYR